MAIPPIGSPIWNLPDYWADKKDEEIPPPIEKPEPKLPDGGINYVW